jgi:hypothetical protein
MDFFYKAAGAVLAPFRYAQREIENTKENLKEDAKEAAANALKIFVLFLCGMFFLVFGSISAATAINASMDSAWLGYASVAGFYLVLAIGTYIWRVVSRHKKEMEKHHN